MNLKLILNVAVGTDYWIVGNTIDGRYETCLRWCQNSYAPKSAKAAIVISSLHIKLSCHSWSCSLAVSNVGLWSGNFLNVAERSVLTLIVFYIFTQHRTREYQLLMLSLIRTSTKVDYVTTHACVNAVILHLVVWGNIPLTLSPLLLNHSMIFGNVNLHQCNRLKVGY